MNEQRVTVGIIGALTTPVGSHVTDLYNELETQLYNIGSKLSLSYCGDMIIYVQSDESACDAGLVLFAEDSDMFSEFQKELVAAGLSVDKKKQKMFVDNWYDGSDPPHLMLTLEKAGFK